MMKKPRKKKKLSLMEELRKRNLLGEGDLVDIPNLQNKDLIEHSSLSLIVRCVNPTVHKVGSLVKTLPSIWGLEGKLRGHEIGEYCVQFIFQHERDLQYVLNTSPWVVNGWTISMDQWTANPSPSFLKHIPFWIQIRNIPIHLIKKETVDLILESLGKVEEIELHAKQSSSLEYVRARVCVDVEEPLQFRRQARLTSGECVTVEFEYENLLKVCFNCKRLTHGQNLCPFNTPKSQVDYSKEFDPIRRSQGKSVVGGTDNPTESFTRQNKHIPKATTYQSTVMSSKINQQPNSAKASGDASQAFAFQYGSLGTDLMKVPARTSSTPRNMDEQKRAKLQLFGVITQMFDKALMEPTFCEMFADLCLHLSRALPDFNKNGEKITFKRLLLNKCQEEFERGEKEEEEASSVAGEGQVEQTEEEREEKRLKVRRRILGNIRLIGELYKRKMLTEKIMHACIQKLLGYDQDPHEENIEALCTLMRTIGVVIDHDKAKIHMDAYFKKMEMLSCNGMPGNAQGGHSRVNLPPMNHSGSKDGLHPNNHNGPNAHSRSQGVSGEPVVGGTANPTESFTRQSGPIPKAPTSQSTVMNSKSNEPPNTAKASGDASQGFAFQFGSLAPDLMKIPARTSSAPPNMDEQKRAQMQQASVRTAPNLPASVPKKDLPNKAADTHLTKKEGQGSGARLDRRPSNMVVDDRWTKNQGPVPAGYGGNVGFRPGQGGNSGVLRNPRMQGPIMSRPMQPVGPMGGMGRSNIDLERWQRGSNFQQKGLYPSPHTPMQVMHKAERKYQVGTVTDEEQAKQRQLKGILKKLTPQNFKKLFEQVKSVEIDNAGTLSGVVSQIFDKALMEPTFCEMYANFCLHLSGALPDFNENGEKITFKRLLLNKCQEEFERGEKEEEEASRVASEGQVEQTEEEREEKRLKVRRRMLGNIRLIGELYKKKMLTEKIMHACIQKLLGYDQDPHEENIEALCTLMSTIGVMIDHYKAKVHMDAYFEKMKMLSCKQELSSGVRFMLINVIDLRKNKWQERMKIEGPN